MKKFLAVVLSVLLIIPFTPISIFAKADNTITYDRDTVLLLDNSGSMEGMPESVMKEAAIKFCKSVLAADGKNRVSIVNFSSDADLKAGFTDNIKDLETAINSADAFGGTDIYQAFQTADTEMKEDSSAKVKNIVLLTDGLPEKGTSKMPGRYSEKDDDSYLNYYEYANAVYDLYTTLMSNYSFYTLGFFHNLNGQDLSFGQKFLNDIQNAGYYEVTDVNQLTFTFGQIASEITRQKGSGSFKYQSGSDRDFSSTYFYDDNYFIPSSYTYNQQLATMSLCLAMSAFGSNETGYDTKYKNVQALMADTGFSKFDKNSWFTVKPTKDSIGGRGREQNDSNG